MRLRRQLVARRGGAGGEILVAGAVAGLLGALAMWLWLVGHSSLGGDGPWVLLQGIAGVLYGSMALLGGPWTVLVGSVVHLAVGVALGVVFAGLAGSKLGALPSLAFAIVYGVVVWLLMTHAIVPEVDRALAARLGIVQGAWFVGHVLYAAPLALVPRFRRDLGGPARSTPGPWPAPA